MPASPEPSPAPRVTAERAGAAAGELLAGRREGAGARTKSGAYDLVTDYDLAAERLVTEIILADHPGDLVIGEEGGARGTGDGGRRWYVDPIDGTNNFVHGLPLFCVSVGAEAAGELVAGCVYDPSRRRAYSADPSGLRLDGRPAPAVDRAGPIAVLTDVPYSGQPCPPARLAAYGRLVERYDVRRIGSTALALALVAVGAADVAVNWGIHPWDVAAGAMLVMAGGGAFHGFEADGSPRSDQPWLAPGFVALGPRLAGDEVPAAVLDCLPGMG